jgi:hypothetical protein
MLIQKPMRPPAMAVPIETIRAVLNSRMRAKFGLRDIGFMILNLNRGATSVDNDDFDKKFSLAKTLTNIRNTSNATTNSSNAQLLNRMSVDCCEKAEEALEFTDVLLCK